MTAARFAVDTRGTVTDLDEPAPIPATALLAPPRFELHAIDFQANRQRITAVVLRDTATGYDYPFVTAHSATSAARSLTRRTSRTDSFGGWRIGHEPPSVTFLDQPVTPIYLETP